MSTGQLAAMLCGWGLNAGCLSALEVVTTMRYTNRRMLYTLLYFTAEEPRVALCQLKSC